MRVYLLEEYAAGERWRPLAGPQGGMPYTRLSDAEYARLKRQGESATVIRVSSYVRERTRKRTKRG